MRARLAAALPRLRRFARSLTHHVADADDLVQRTLEKALRSAAQWRPPEGGADEERVEGSLRAWMFGIMKNTWIDDRRARQRELRVVTSGSDDADAADPVGASIEDRLSLDAALERLPDEQRLVVSLVLVEGLSYREAAEVADVPIGTLTSRLARARERLVALLGTEAG